MTPRTEAELSAQLRGLAVDPPDNGFAQRLSERLQQQSAQSEHRSALARLPRPAIGGNRKLVLLLAAAAVLVAGGAAAVVGPANVTRWIARWTVDTGPVPRFENPRPPRHSPSIAPSTEPPVPAPPESVEVPRVEIPQPPTLAEVDMPRGAAPRTPQRDQGSLAPASRAGARPSPAMVGPLRRNSAGPRHRGVRRAAVPSVPAASPQQTGKTGERLRVPRVRLAAPVRSRVARDSLERAGVAGSPADERPLRPGPAAARLGPGPRAESGAAGDTRRLREKRLERRARRREQRELRQRQRTRARPGPRGQR